MYGENPARVSGLTAIQCFGIFASNTFLSKISLKIRLCLTLERIYLFLFYRSLKWHIAVSSSQPCQFGISSLLDSR